MDDHVSRILKMLEEGKISADDASKLLSAVRQEATTGPSSSASSTRPSESRTESTTGQSQDAGKAKSFEFQWSQKRGLPFDLSGLGKQISDAVKKIDPERLVREARSGIARGGKRFNARFKGFAWFTDGDDGRPENVLGHPTARVTETLDFDLKSGATVQVENSWGALAVFGGGDQIKLEYSKEVWGPTETDAAARLGELKVEAATHEPEGESPRLEVRVDAPEGWRHGTVDLRLYVPEDTTLRLSSIFGEVRVEKTAAEAEVHSIGGSVALDGLKGAVRAETISGDMSARNIGGLLNMASKSGDLSANGLSKGGSVTGVSGDLRVSNVEGGRLEAKSVSGDVHVESAGNESPVDVRAESISGDLRLTHGRGNMTLKTVSGDVTAEQVDALTFQAETVSGDVKVALEAPFSGTLTTNTVSGDVVIDAPVGSHFRFTLATQSGELHCTHEAQDSSKSDTLWSGAVGTGAGTVTIQTRSGDVFLQKPE